MSESQGVLASMSPVPEDVVDSLVNANEWCCIDCGHMPEPLRLEVHAVTNPVHCSGSPHHEHTAEDHRQLVRLVVARCTNTAATRECPDCRESYGSGDCPSAGQEQWFGLD